MDENDINQLLAGQKNIENSNKMVELLTQIAEDTKSIKGWVLYFGILSLLSIFVTVAYFFSILASF